MKKHVPTALALLALVVALWRPVTAEPPPPDTLEVRELHVVDAKGKTRILLRVAPNALQPGRDVVELKMSRYDGKTAAYMRVSGEDGERGKPTHSADVCVFGPKGDARLDASGCGAAVQVRGGGKVSQLQPAGVKRF